MNGMRSNKFIIKEAADGETKTPGVVAKLMGLDSLPTTKNPPPEVTKSRGKKQTVKKQATEGKSISLALQAKANVLKREKQQSIIGQNDATNNEVKRRSSSPSSVLRENNQKQNLDRGSSMKLLKSSDKKQELNSGIDNRKRNVATPEEWRDKFDGCRKRKSNKERFTISEDKENETCNIFLFDSQTGKSFAESVHALSSGSNSSSSEEKTPHRRSLASSRKSENKRTKGNLTDKHASAATNTTPKCQVETTTGKQELSRFPDTKSFRCNYIDTADNNATAASSTTTAPASRNRQNSWEVEEYVKEVLCDVETMLKDYAFGRTTEVINPPLFYQIECRRLCSNSSASKGLIPRVIRRLWFDCISECTAIRCRRYVGEGWESWARGLRMVHRKDELAEDICQEISDFNDMGNLMVDEIVGRDMSSKHGTWRNYELEGFEVGIQIESCILNSMVNEIVADIIKT